MFDRARLLDVKTKEYLTLIHSAFHEHPHVFFNKEGIYPIRIKMDFIVIVEGLMTEIKKLGLDCISCGEKILFDRKFPEYRGSKKDYFSGIRLSNLKYIARLETLSSKKTNISLAEASYEKIFLRELNLLKLNCVAKVKQIYEFPAGENDFGSIITYEKEYTSLINLKQTLLDISKIRKKEPPFGISLKARLQIAKKVLEILEELEMNNIVNRNITLEHLHVSNINLTKGADGAEQLDYNNLKVVLSDWSLACLESTICSAEGAVKCLDLNILHTSFQDRTQSFTPYRASHIHDSWSAGMVIWSLFFNDYHPIHESCEDENIKLSMLFSQFRKMNQLLSEISNPFAHFFLGIFKTDGTKRKKSDELIASFETLVRLSEYEIEEQILQISKVLYPQEWHDTEL